MRRFLIVCLCLATFGCVVLLLAGRSRGAGRLQRVDPDVETRDAEPDEVEEEGAGQPVAVDTATLPDPADRAPDPDLAGREAELALERLVQVRADVAASVERSALFLMARDRGLPNHELFTMTPEQLLDATLEAEGLPPADVLPSPQTEERVMAVAAEAYRRHEEYLAERAPERDAG
ncbi:MAG: hypothetical protein QOG33_970 [Gaiellales bacterium]|jgi:hypothetical protein|nr:hypothetical protein [Gaiellales bacterium]